MLGGRIPVAQLVDVDGQELAPGVADEVGQEEYAGVGVGGLHEWVGFERAVEGQSVPFIHDNVYVLCG